MNQGQFTPDTILHQSMPDLTFGGLGFFASRKTSLDLAIGRDDVQKVVAGSIESRIREHSLAFVLVGAKDGALVLFVRPDNKKEDGQPKSARNFSSVLANHAEVSDPDKFFAALDNATATSTETVWSNLENYLPACTVKGKQLHQMVAILAPECYVSQKHFPGMFERGLVCLGFCFENRLPELTLKPLILRADLEAVWFTDHNRIGPVQDNPRYGKPFPFFAPIASLTGLLSQPAAATLFSHYQHFVQTLPGGARTDFKAAQFPARKTDQPVESDGAKVSWQVIIEHARNRQRGDPYEGIPLSMKQVDLTGCSVDDLKLVKSIVLRAYQVHYQGSLRHSAN